MISQKHKFILTPKNQFNKSNKTLLPYCDVKKINKQSNQRFDIIDEFTSNKYGSKHITIEKVQNAT